MAFQLRAATPGDADPAGRICYHAFKAIAEQHGFPPDFPSEDVTTRLLGELVSRPDVHGVIAELDGHVAGSNFLWAAQGRSRHRSDHRRSCLAEWHDRPPADGGSPGSSVQEEGTRRVRLVQAAYHSRSLSLYTKLGFVAREQLAVLVGTVEDASPRGYDVRPAQPKRICSRQAKSAAGTWPRPRSRSFARCDPQRIGYRRGREGRITGYATETRVLRPCSRGDHRRPEGARCAR